MDPPPISVDGDPILMSNHSHPPSSYAGAINSGELTSQPFHNHSQPKFSNGPHMRSRITVVCAECKRLKLRCDRRTPCGSCLKRDTVPRCIYSQAATEKIDVQSLHNRLLVLEGSHGTNQASTSSTQSIFQTSASTSAVISSSSSNGDHIAGMPCNERAVLAVGSAGASVIVNMEEIANIWMSSLARTSFDATSASQVKAATSANTSATGRPRAGSSAVKIEPSSGSVPLPASATTPQVIGPGANSCKSRDKSLNSFEHMLAVPYSSFIPLTSAASPATQPTTHITTPTHPYPVLSSEQSASSDKSPNSIIPEGTTNMQGPPQVTASILAYLPKGSARKKLMEAFKEAASLHSSLHIPHFVRRMDLMMGDSSSTSVSGDNGTRGKNATQPPMSKEELAKEIFAKPKKTKESGKEKNKEKEAAVEQPTLSFFSAVCAAMALGALLTDSASSETDKESSSDGKRRKRGSGEGEEWNAGRLYALSEQALAIHERVEAYDLDYVWAVVLQVMCLMHEGRANLSQSVFALVGKMINVARMAGLALDPDEFSGTYTLFDAEMRRRVWWDIVYYDLLVSDCMGHAPLISEHSFTTHIPAEVEDDLFNPASVSLPTLSVNDREQRSTYITLKCRFTLLSKSVRRQATKEPFVDDSGELSIDQIAPYEADIINWLTDLPPAFRLSFQEDLTATATLAFPIASPLLMAQRCALALTAQRLMLKLYLPYLKDCRSQACTALIKTATAASEIINAARIMHASSNTIPLKFYEFGRGLFDAAVVSAQVVVQQPKSLIAGETMRMAGRALEIMRNLDGTKEDDRSEAIRVVENMIHKAEGARTGSSTNAGAGAKRKRGDIEGETLGGPGFQLPYVGPAITSIKSRPPQSISRPSTVSSRDPPAKDLPKARADAEKRKEKEKDKERRPYPSIGVRARMKPRTSATPNATAPSSHGRMQAPPTPTTEAPPSVHVPPILAPAPMQDQQPRLPKFSPYPPVPPPARELPTQELTQHEDYNMGYPNEEIMTTGERRYSNSYSSTPSSSGMFEAHGSPYAQSQASPLAYDTGTSPQNYYAPYPQPSGPGYDSATPHHSSMPNFSETSPMDMASVPPVSRGAPQPYHIYDKTVQPGPSYVSHANQPSEQGTPRPMDHEYRPPQTPHSMATWSQQSPGPNSDSVWPPDYSNLTYYAG